MFRGISGKLASSRRNTRVDSSDARVPSNLSQVRSRKKRLSGVGGVRSEQRRPPFPPRKKTRRVIDSLSLGKCYSLALLFPNNTRRFSITQKNAKLCLFGVVLSTFFCQHQGNLFPVFSSFLRTSPESTLRCSFRRLRFSLEPPICSSRTCQS